MNQLIKILSLLLISAFSLNLAANGFEEGYDFVGSNLLQCGQYDVLYFQPNTGQDLDIKLDPKNYEKGDYFLLGSNTSNELASYIITNNRDSVDEVYPIVTFYSEVFDTEIKVNLSDDTITYVNIDGETQKCVDERTNTVPIENQ